MQGKSEVFSTYGSATSLNKSIQQQEVTSITSETKLTPDDPATDSKPSADKDPNKGSVSTTQFESAANSVIVVVDQPNEAQSEPNGKDEAPSASKQDRQPSSGSVNPPVKLKLSASPWTVATSSGSAVKKFTDKK
mgnify:FL=1